MSGADLANLVNEGALLAARRNHEKVYMSDLEEAKDKVMLGAERKSMVMSDDEKRNTAYHEAGHAICAIKTPGNDPLHKVTIVPRGRALGVAFTLPEDDRVSMTREQLEAHLVMAYGGRVAEEIVFGKDRVTTGASSDIQQATKIARRYVTQWGLSDEIGPILVGDNEQELFLGREIQSRREVSEQTAQTVDREVTRVIMTAYNRAKEVLTENLVAAACSRYRAARPRDAHGRRGRDARSRRDTSAVVEQLATAASKLQRARTSAPQPSRLVRRSLAVRRSRLRKATIVGVVNVTPDSFSDGGNFLSAPAAIDHALALADAGADVIEVGGESTRPGAVAVDADVEIERAIPVISRAMRSRSRNHDRHRHGEGERCTRRARCGCYDSQRRVRDASRS